MAFLGPTTTQTLTNSTTTVDSPGQTTSDLSVTPFIRESNLDFVGYNLRPTREVWYYFDDKEMSHFISRPNIIKFDARKDFGDMLFNTPRERVRFPNGGFAKVLLNETDANTGNTTLYVSQIEACNGIIGTGNTVTGNLTSLFANIVSYQHQTGLLRAANTSYITLSLDAQPTDNYYSGNVITVVTGPIAGESSNIVSYNASSRVAIVSPAFSANANQNDIYTIGDIRKNYLSSSRQRHYTTDRGMIAGTLHLPDPNANTTYAFRTGDRIFRILDNPLNQLVTDGGDKAYTCRADYRYTTAGLTTTETQVINRVVTNAAITLTTTLFDPIAQSFFVDGNVYKEGMFIPSIDLFFKNRGENLPVTVQIRPMVEGYPSATAVLPYAEAVLFPEDVKAVDIPNTQNSQTATRFTFPSPVYVAPDQEYAFVILTNDYGYDLWVSEVGQNEVGTGRWVSQQPYLGSMFKSQSGRTFTALQNEDVMFVVNKCKFDTSGQVLFTDLKSPNVTLPYLANTSFTANAFYDFFQYQSDFAELPGTQVNMSYRGRSNTTGSLDTTYTAFTPDKNTLLSERKVVYGPQYAPSFNVQMQISTTNQDVSPVIYQHRQNLVVVQNKINNMELSNSLVAITSAGSGYSNGAITFSSSSTGVSAAGIANVNATGAIVSTTVTSPGSGFFDTITATVAGGTGAVLKVASETDPSGGPAAARYISKTVTLADGFDSGDLRLYLTACKPQTSNIQVYYKVRNSLDPDAIDNKNWVRMTQIGNTLKFSAADEAYEYEYRPSVNANSVSYTTNTATYKTFNEFKIKVVLASSSTLFQDVPKLYDVRAIALPADRY